MKRKGMEVAVFWLVIIGPLLIGLSAPIWYAGSRTPALWVCFAGLALLMLAAALQFQQFIWKSQTEWVQRNRVQQERAQQERAQRERAPDFAPATLGTPGHGAQEAVTEDRIFVSKGITPEYLLSFFHQQHTVVQATNATKDYIGKWMKITGSVGNVLAGSERQAQVTFERQRSVPREWVDYTDVYMYFRGPWRERAIILKKGDNITVIGQIEQIEAVALHLGNCEFHDDRLTSG